MLSKNEWKGESMITVAFADYQDGRQCIEWSDDCGWSDEDAANYAHQRGNHESQRNIFAENFASEDDAREKYPEYFE